MSEDTSVIWPDQPEMVYHMPYLESVASRCSIIIEIGCGHGNGSTRAFERGLLRTTHSAGARLFVSVDNNPDKPDVKPSIPCWEKVTADSRSSLAKADVWDLLCGSSIEVDLIYIDTDHTYFQLAAELINYFPMAGPSTIWLFHDTWMSGVYNPMTDAILDFCKLYPEWEYVEITRESHGLGMMKWRESK